MSIRQRSVGRLVACSAMLAGLIVVPQLVNDPPVSTVAAPCVNGVIPLNPYIQNCNLPPRRGNRVRGAAPDAGAIIACRDNPWCLSDYVNGGFGWP